MEIMIAVMDRMKPVVKGVISRFRLVAMLPIFDATTVVVAWN